LKKDFHVYGGTLWAEFLREIAETLSLRGFLPNWV
jgi:hypothetical protein